MPLASGSGVASETSPVIQELNIMSQQRLLNRDSLTELVVDVLGSKLRLFGKSLPTSLVQPFAADLSLEFPSKWVV